MRVRLKPDAPDQHFIDKGKIYEVYEVFPRYLYILSEVGVYYLYPKEVFDNVG